jgi:glycosyltransferase involved in cell wall biosynthesis
VLSIILPTYNEAQNLPILLGDLARVLGKDPYEVIVVDDDSPDNTWQVATNLKKQYPMLRVIRRVGRRGLSSAVVEGFDVATGDILLVMDSDLQHDPALIVKLRDAVESGAGIAVASRYIEGGSVGEWVTGRRLLSKIATFFARNIPHVKVSDPMSGFFALKKSVFDAIKSQLRPTGFKILFEVLTFLPKGTKAVEVPLVFKMREHGESKLSAAVEMQFLFQLVHACFIRFQWIMWWFIVVIAFVTLMMRFLPLLPMYLDASIRQNVQQSLERVADEHGWLISDLAIERVEETSMRVIHQSHHRGTDEVECLIITFADSSITPCVD